MHQEGARTGAFVATLGAASLLLGAAVRLRLHVATPLPSSHPVPWLLAGAADDLALLGLGAVVALLTARSRPRAARMLFAAWSAAVVLSLFAWSEIVVYFGHPPRRTDLAVGARADFVLRSLDPAVLVRLLVVALLLVLAIAVAARRSVPALSAGAAAAAAALGLAAAFVPLPVPMRVTARHPLFSVAGHGASLSASTPLEGPPAFRPLASAPSALPAPTRAPAPPRPSDAPHVPPGVRPNVVFVLLEGMRAEELGAWGGLEGLVPHLDDLARRGIRVSRAYSPGTHTPEGELALWYGLLASPRRLVLKETPDAPRDGLPEVLRLSGWRSLLFIFNGDQTFYGRDRFYSPRGFRTLDGRDFDPSRPRTNWGYSDKSLVEAAVRTMDRLEEPFAAMVLTVSNHHPFQVPSDATTSFTPPVAARGGFVSLPGVSSLLGLHTGGMLKTIHYADEAVGDLLALAEGRPWYGRTVFVLCGDHGLPIAPLDGTPSPHRFADLRHHVPLVVFSPLLAGGVTIDDPASLADVPATLLGLFGLPGPLGDGRDLFAPSDAPAIAWDDEGRTATAVSRRFTYHTVLEAGPDGRIAATRETLFAAEDRAGAEDLAAREPQALTKLRDAVLAWAAAR